MPVLHMPVDCLKLQFPFLLTAPTLPICSWTNSFLPADMDWELTRCPEYKSGKSSGIFRNIFWVRIFPITYDLNSVFQTGPALVRTKRIYTHRAIAPMEHQVRSTRWGGPAPRKEQCLASHSHCILGSAGPKRAAPESCRDLGKWHTGPCSAGPENPAVAQILWFQHGVQWRRWLLLSEIRVDEESRLEGPCTSAQLCLGQGRRIFTCPHFFHTKISYRRYTGESKF